MKKEPSAERASEVAAVVVGEWGVPRQTEIVSFEASKGEEVVATGRKRGGFAKNATKTEQNKAKQKQAGGLV